SQSQKAEPRPLSTLRAWRQSEQSPTEGWNTGGVSRGTSAFDDDVHGTPAADNALPVAAHGVAINLIDLGHQPEGRGEAGDLIGDVFVAVDDASIRFEFDGVGGLVVGDAIGMHLALGGRKVLEFVEDAEGACFAGG